LEAALVSMTEVHLLGRGVNLWKSALVMFKVESPFFERVEKS
jgi:hypothetical protein